MSDTAVTERRIRPIQDALAAGNVKQALKDCEKWQKKGEASDRFLALKAAVLVNQPDAKSQEKGKAETLQLCDRKPAVVNLDAIYQLQNTLQQLSLGREQTPKLWARAVATRPNDKDLLSTWLKNSITENDWPSAQKAAMALKKASPQDRQYEFWNILMSFFVHQDTSLSQQDRTLFGTLANRMITKLAQPPATDKTISNPEELSMLANILVKTGAAKTLLEILSKDDLKPAFDQDPLFFRTMQLQALYEAGDDNQILSYCQTNIFDSSSDDAEPVTDDRVWQLVPTIAKSEHSRKDLLKKVNDLIVTHPQHRQAHLTKLDLILLAIEQNELEWKSFQTACEMYYEALGDKSFWYDDVISRLEKAGNDASHKIQTSLNTTDDGNASLAKQLLQLKLQYYNIYQGHYEEKDLSTFAAKSIELYNASRKKGKPLPEAIYIAAIATIGHAVTSNDASLFLQANTMLRTCAAQNKDYYPVTILLMQLQLGTGQIHLALRNFFDLNVKNLQWETFGHLLLTRISTLHPLQHGRGEESLNPLGAFDTALSVFDNADRSLDQAINQGLKYGSYSNIMDTFNVRRNLHRSLVRQLFSIEERKCLRAWNLNVENVLHLTKDELVDLRDYSYMPRYNVVNKKLDDFLQCGPVPQRNWLDAMIMHDHVVTYLKYSLAGDNDQAQHALDSLISLSLNPAIAEEGSDLTSSERDGLGVVIAVAILLSSTKREEYDPLQVIMTWLKENPSKLETTRVNSVAYPTGAWLHAQFVRLELLQTVSSLTGFLAKKTKSGGTVAGYGNTDWKQTIVEIQQLVRQETEAVHEAVKAVKEGLRSEGVLGRLVDAAVGNVGEGDPSDLAKAIQGLQDETEVEEYCGLARESWEDALDGILAVTVRIPK